MNKKKIMLTIIAVVALSFTGRFFYLGSKSADMEVNLGVVDGQLTKCPDKPNCINSFETDRYDIPAISAQKNLIPKLQIYFKSGGYDVVKSEDDYIHATIASKIFKFTDDIEFYYKQEDGKLHFRSASRVGHSDLGVNKGRIQEIVHYLKNTP